MDTNRRTFLIQTGAALGVIGIAALFQEGPAKPAPAPADAGRAPGPRKAPGPLLGAAIRKMRAERKPGVALLIPEDPHQRHRAGHVLANHLMLGGPERDEMFAETVFVCLEAAAVREELSAADASHSLFLFDPSGRVTASISFDYSKKADDFHEEVRGLVHGKDGSRLRRRADEILASLDPGVARALSRLETAEDRALVFDRAATMVPLLVHEKLQTPSGRRRDALEGLLRRYLASCRPDEPGPKLPFGVELGSHGGGCGDCCAEMAPREVAIKCGMGRLDPGARFFVRYLKA